MAAVSRLSEDVRRHVERAARAPEMARAGCHAAAERLLRDAAGALARRRAWAHAASAGIVLGRLLLERGRAPDAAAALAEAAGQADSAGDDAAAQEARLWQAAARTDAGQLVAAEAQCRAILAAGAATAVIELRARAALARILLWQGRGDEAAELNLAGAESGSPAEPYVLSTWVRVLLHRGDVFEAGRRARDLVTSASAGDDPLAQVIACGAHARVMATMGDLTLAEASVERLSVAARIARTPLRVVRARLLLADAYRRSGRTLELNRELTRLRRVRGAAPALLRQSIDRRVKSGADAVWGPPSGGPSAAWGPPSGGAASAPALISMAREEADDREAIARLLAAGGASLRSTRIDLHSAEGGPVSPILSAGNGQATGLGRRVLEAGIVIGPEGLDGGHELAVPVRLGSTLLAALGARWPADRPAPGHARALLELIASVAAPRVDALLSSSRAEAAAAIAVPELVGGSAGMTELRQAVARAAAAPFAVLIEGESGVGKELVARALHQLGPRRERRFCDVNCAALPDELLESELFGHARGAFTGAVTDRPGLFEDADGGTVFLDEVADLSARAQAKLLRVIQQQEVRRVGETFSRAIDVRIVAAANRDMRAEAASGRFRQDLLYRLDVIRITIPPLRERPDDVAALAGYFWKVASARVASTAVLTHGVLAALARYHWPGNVRELQNVMAALAVAAPARGAVRPHLLPAAIAGVVGMRSGRLGEARAEFERRFVEAALARAGGSRTRAARELGVTRQGLMKILARVGAR